MTVLNPDTWVLIVGVLGLGTAVTATLPRRRAEALKIIPTLARRRPRQIE